jgi:ParB-like chromosome segregation protein Spo0J
MNEPAATPAPPRLRRAPAPRAARQVAATGGITLPGPIEYWPIDRLKPHPNDPRIHTPQQINRIAASILEFGFTAPILVDEKGAIIAGRGRLAAARKLALERLPVVQLKHLSETQRRAYRLADNKLALEAEWDPALLARELRELEKQAFDLAAIGFSAEELRELEEAARKLETPVPTARTRGPGAKRILDMLEFDSQEQKDRWVEFKAWLRGRAPGKSAGAALAAHAAAAMSRRGR